MVTNFGTTAFLLGLRRFIARRGAPDSDSAQQFKMVQGPTDSVELSKEDTVIDYSSQQGIRWSNIIAQAPRQGGLYERFIGLSKEALRRAIG